MQNDFKEFREGRSLCYAVELFGNLQRFLRIVRLSAHGFRLGCNNDPIYPDIEW